MKARNYSIMTVAILFILSLTGCSNESENIPQTDAQSVVIKLDLSGDKTRAVADPTTATTKELKFKDGYLFFVNEYDIITKRIEILPVGYAQPLTDDQIKIDLLTASQGHEIEGVPGSSTKVYMIGNIPSGVTVPTSGNIKDVQALPIAVGTQNDAAGSTTVSLYGTGDIKEYETPKPNAKQAAISVNVIAGRIELGKLTADEDGNIESFKIDGVYINRYCPEMTLDGKAASAAFVNNGDDTTNYPQTTAGTGTPYDGLKLHDWYGTPLASTDNEAVPATNKVWAYNLLAPTAKLADTDTDGFERPRVIIRLSDIKLKNSGASSSAYNVPMYLTMRLKEASGTEEIASFEPGHVYQIDDVEFDEHNLYNAPEKSVISVGVTVTLVDWVLVSSGVILN